MPPVAKLARDLTVNNAMGTFEVNTAPSSVFAQAYLQRVAQKDGLGTLPFHNITGLAHVVKQPPGGNQETIHLAFRPHWFDHHVTQVTFLVAGPAASGAMFDLEFWG